MAQKLAGTMRILFVVPDYYEDRPKRCMNGWGSTFMTITPDGTALPCHTAQDAARPDVSERARRSSMRDIWFQSDGFNRFRGTGLDEGAVRKLRGAREAIWAVAAARPICSRTIRGCRSGLLEKPSSSCGH